MMWIAFFVLGTITLTLWSVAIVLTMIKGGLIMLYLMFTTLISVTYLLARIDNNNGIFGTTEMVSSYYWNRKNVNEIMCIVLTIATYISMPLLFVPRFIGITVNQLWCELLQFKGEKYD